jgi:hypothetical protein
MDSPAARAPKLIRGEERARPGEAREGALAALFDSVDEDLKR